MNFNYYAKSESGIFPIEEDQISALNEKQHDIFWTPQIFKSYGKRKKEDLEALRYVCGDFDKITLDELEQRLINIPMPSMIIGTRSGFHVYWELKNPIIANETTADMYRDFVQRTLVECLGADEQAKDVSRILRVPMTRYWRDSKNNIYLDPAIYCQIVFESEKKYDLETLIKYMPLKIKPIEPLPMMGKKMLPQKKLGQGNFWEKANQLDAKSALMKLSGTSWVAGERFEFKKQKNMTRIIINGKARNVWLDADGAIGSISGGGPTIVNWLAYYGHDMKKIAEILKQEFPEIGE